MGKLNKCSGKSANITAWVDKRELNGSRSQNFDAARSYYYVGMWVWSAAINRTTIIYECLEVIIKQQF